MMTRRDFLKGFLAAGAAWALPGGIFVRRLTGASYINSHRGMGPLDPEVIVWRDRVIAAGGGFESNSISIAQNLITQLKASTFNQNILYLLPLLGTGINAARVPLRDTLNVGAASNNSFLDVQFSQSTGLEYDGGPRLFDTGIKPNQLGTDPSFPTAGGMGHWELNFTNAAAGVEYMGCYNIAGDQRFCIDLRNTIRGFQWGSPGNGAYGSGTASNKLYYGQRPVSVLRQAFEGDAPPINENLTTDTASGVADRTIWCFACNSNLGAARFPTGRSGVQFLTDGVLNDFEVTDLHTLLRDYLMVPTGRV